MTRNLGRRDVLRGAAGLTFGGAVAGTPAAAQASEPFDGFLANTSNFDGIVDERGSDTVTIAVGAEGNNGAYAYGPAAVQVDPGTELVWEWTGDGGSHNVAATDGAFESEMMGDAGATFSQSLESEGVLKYECTPHTAMGMRGVVVVGSLPEGAAVETATPAEEASSGPDFGDWFDNVDNFDGVVDRTGQNEVHVTVGADGNNGAYAFGPAAVRVDPGTAVVWEWNGEGGSHNVAATDGSFESELTGESGFTFEQTFQEAGITRYACLPHEQMGMKGAVVVGRPEATGLATPEGKAAVAGGLGLVGLLYALFLRGTDEGTPVPPKRKGPNRS